MYPPVTPEELNVAYRAGLTEQDYAKCLQKYARETGTSVESLKGLNREDLEAARQMGTDFGDLQKAKLEGVAEDVIRRTWDGGED
jgi:hypothetical protein